MAFLANRQQPPPIQDYWEGVPVRNPDGSYNDPALNQRYPQQNQPIQNQQQQPGGAQSGFVPNYYNTFIQPMVPQPGGLQGTNPLSSMPELHNDNPNTIRGSGADLSGINTQQAFQGLGTPDLKNHDQVFQLGQNLQRMGHNVKPGPIDMYGRMDSLIVDGQVARVFDSNGNWILKSNAGGDAWAMDGPGAQGGMQSTGPTQQNDPNAWRRQHEMRQHQTPQYGGGWGYGGMGSGMPVSQPNTGVPYTTGINGGYGQFPANGSAGPMGMGSNNGSQVNYGAQLQGTAPSSIANAQGQPTNHPLANRLMY